MNDATPVNTEPGTLRELIAAQAGVAFSSDDVLLLVTPLFEQVAALHAEGKVAALGPNSVILDPSGALALRRPEGQQPSLAMDAVNRVQPLPVSGLNILGTLHRERDEHGRETVTDDAVQTDAEAPIARPVYLPGPGSWEQRIGQHDDRTDIFVLGMILAALSCGLDFTDEDDLRNFVARRTNLFTLQDRLHPVFAAVIVEMTELNRHQRATEVAALGLRLRTWRDQPAGLDVERAMAGATGSVSRRSAVLAHLRDRLFDLSRRNRLLHFKPNASTVNLTVASVPLVLQAAAVRAEQICTWGAPFAEEVLGGKPVTLNQWLRFEEQTYLPASLDQLLVETRRDRAEFGSNNLRLVVAFLRWHNLKEAPDERIVTPLLWLPVELSKRKGVRDQYLLQSGDTEAEFNPVLRHQLAQLYDIRLPEKVSLDQTSIAAIHADILAQIRRSEPAVELRLVSQASIQLVRHKAMQRMQQYQRRKSSSRPRMPSGAGLPPYSYDRADYRPLGRVLFEQWVRPSPLPQRFEAGAPPSAALRQPQMADVEERSGYALLESDGHRYAWDVDLTQVSLANFNYKKMSLVRDYAQLLAEPAANPAFDQVFSIEPRAVETAMPPPLAPGEQWSVVAADATQNAAVSLARSARSFIIQGPPGTGKSQTITNLIADYAGRGKRVLFVCEKRAALDVVFNRLKQSGLAPLCSLIHDSQSDKKAFIADLKGCYEAWIGQTHDSEALQASRAALVGALAAHQNSIERFEQALAAAPEVLGASIRALLRRIAALPPAPQAVHATREQLPALSAWDGQRDLVRRLQSLLRERFGVQSLAAHPFANLSAALVADERAFHRANTLCRQAEALFDALEPQLDASGALIGPDTSLAQACTIAADSGALLASRLAGHLDLLEPNSAGAAALREARVALDASAAALVTAQAANLHWRDKLTAIDTASALELARRLAPSALRWLQPQWWRLRGELQRRYDFAQHAVHPGYIKVLENLAGEQAAATTLDTSCAALGQRYDVPDMPAFLQALEQLAQQLQAGRGPRALIASLRAHADPLGAARSAAVARQPLDALLALLGPELTTASDVTLDQIAEMLRDLREALDDLPDLLPMLRALHAGDAHVARMLQQLDYTPEQLDALVADEALRRVERDSPVLAHFGGAALAQAARAVTQHQRQLLVLDAQVIRATLHRQFSDHVRVSGLAAGQLDEAGKLYKKRYATGRRELEHEFGKSMRYRSIRDLSDDATGMVINDLKPVWLMSPLSVSDTLPLAPELFDVVIFDEASQIPVEEAVPALSRARQIIVVGDEMQLPPTSFFSTGGATGGDDIVVEENGEKIAINLDSDSLLAQAARSLPATLLAWHYRSRHESLISFSNAAFYDGRLVTIPDTRLDLATDAPPARRSDLLDAGVSGADTLLAHPISYHRLDDGLYADRRNGAEARYIAQTVRELLRRDCPLSIGIVAFSEAQQSEIETALETLGADDPDFGGRLEQAYVREDDEQFNGLFVKNLENVQGDERDIIILSICYAPGADGKMLMNFGPINQRGGEKRLNVIFSRARHRMAVVTSIEPQAITNVHNDGAAALRGFLEFAKASAAGQGERARSVLGALNPAAGDAFTRAAPHDSIRDALAAALRARGHDVHVHVGRSQLRCDLAIVDPSGAGYALAILLDNPADAVPDTLERYVFRPAILRSFGWRVLDVPGKDWLDDAASVLRRIEGMLSNGEDHALDVEIAPLAVELRVEAPSAPQESEPPAAAPSQAEANGHARSLRFEQGTSRKFWRVSVQGAELRVKYGRIGSAGQDNVKQFDSAERALRELNKLVEEKLRKGYVEE
ncbi:MAG: AAA domain-containing protein [Pseudomonadota bacterium]